MTSPFSFRGEIGRVAYLGGSLAAFFLQHAFAYAVLLPQGRNLQMPWWFWLSPMRALASRMDALPEWFGLLALALMLAVMWTLLALAYRRIRSTHAENAGILLVVVPVVQLAVFAWLSVLPDSKHEPREGEVRETGNIRVLALGLLLGAALCLAAAALSTLVFGIYGYGLFVASPFVVGITVAELANRHAALGLGSTTSLVMGALGLGALVLIGVAIEGAICLVFASPLIAFMGFMGALVGRAIANGRRSRRTAVMSVALLPLLLAGEWLVPPRADFESVLSVDIAATPAEVWDSVVHMGPIPNAPDAPFSWGLAYPVRGEINGSGVGAVRRGVFSTGVAYERVVAWVPERQLDFIVLSDPPSMRELSPYEHVNALHTQSYFRTRDARFAITPLADGRTRLTLATHHDLDLEPALYWLPFARWAVHANKVRVLRHFRQQAEGPG